MGKLTKYPTVTDIIEFNLLSLSLIKAKKADKPQLLNKTKIRDILDECEDTEGDMYQKASVILKGLIQKHPFASGNRRGLHS